MDVSSSIQTPSAAHLRNSNNTEMLPSSTPHNASMVTAPETFVSCMKASLWSRCQFLPLSKVLLWSSCISLLVVSFILEQENSPAWLRVLYTSALYLACLWLVPIGLHINALMRTFQDRGRNDLFVGTTASLFFVFIKAFAITDGYGMVALIRIPPCLTFAVWIASYCCTSEVPPQFQFGA